MRILHTMLRVGDLDRSIDFYTRVLGMQLIRRKDYPDGDFTIVFVGYGSDEDNAVLELTYNWGQDSYEMGTAYGHVAIEVDDVYAATEKARAGGVRVLREAGPMNAGTTILSFLEDPDGYQIELLGKGWQRDIDTD